MKLIRVNSRRRVKNNKTGYFELLPEFRRGNYASLFHKTFSLKWQSYKSQQTAQSFYVNADK